METQEKDKPKSSDGEADPAIPEDGYECPDPEMRSVVLNFFNGFERERKEDVALHLRLCSQCEETVTNLFRIDRAVEAAREHCLHPAPRQEAAAPKPEAAVENDSRHPSEKTKTEKPRARRARGGGE